MQHSFYSNQLLHQLPHFTSKKGSLPVTRPLKTTADRALAAITTDVHRNVFASETTAYALINGSGLLREQYIDANVLDITRFRTELMTLAGGDNPYLRLVIRFDGVDQNKATEQFLEAAVKELCRDAGFATIHSSRTYSSLTWDRFADRFREAPEKGAELQGRTVERPLIRAHAIRTNLSRVVLGDADCMVAIHRPFDGRQETLSEELRRSIEETVVLLQLDSRNQLCFNLSSTAAGEPIIEKLFGNQPTSPADVFVKELGFESMTYSHSPGGGAPQLLIGRPAPDFQLPFVDGTDFILSEHIKNRVAIVTFWGVACTHAARKHLICRVFS